MIGEWRTASGTALVDVFLWLEDGAGEKVVYPNAPRGKAFHGMGAYPADAPNKQWIEWEIRSDLVRRATYQVCVSVLPKGSGDGPNIQNADVKGLQVGFEY